MSFRLQHLIQTTTSFNPYWLSLVNNNVLHCWSIERVLEWQIITYFLWTVTSNLINFNTAIHFNETVLTLTWFQYHEHSILWPMGRFSRSPWCNRMPHHLVSLMHSSFTRHNEGHIDTSQTFSNKDFRLRSCTNVKILNFIWYALLLKAWNIPWK